MPEHLPVPNSIYVCPECGEVATMEGASGATCTGYVTLGSEHPVAVMVPTRIIAAEATDEMVERAALMLGTGGHGWGEMPDLERESWRNDARDALTAAFGTSSEEAQGG